MKLFLNKDMWSCSTEYYRFKVECCILSQFAIFLCTSSYIYLFICAKPECCPHQSMYSHKWEGKYDITPIFKVKICMLCSYCSILWLLGHFAYHLSVPYCMAEYVMKKQNRRCTHNVTLAQPLWLWKNNKHYML
jgi:hypothetical protein